MGVTLFAIHYLLVVGNELDFIHFIQVRPKLGNSLVLLLNLYFLVFVLRLKLLVLFLKALNLFV